MSFRLPRMPATQPDWQRFQIWWQEVVEAIEAQEDTQDQALADIQASLALANSSLALIQSIIAANATPSMGGGSGGGTAASDNTLAAFNSASHAAISDELTVVAGAGGVVTLTADSLAVSTAAAAPAGPFKVYGKWQWDSTGGGVWVDVGTEDASSPDAEVENFGGFYGVTAGSLTSSEAKTGLVALSSHKFRFLARNDSGVRTMYLSGTVSAVGS